MKIAFFLDEVSQAIDNAMQWNVMSQLCQGLSKDHQITMLDPLKMGIQASQQALLEQDYDLLLTYNKTGTNLSDPATGRNLMSLLEKPQISWLTEHPVTFYDQYRQTNSAYRHYLYPSEHHAFFAGQMGMQGTNRALLFGATPQKVTGNFGKRPYDICIAAQWRGPADANAFWLKMNAQQKRFFEDINVLQHLEDRGDVYTAFLAAAEHHRVPLQRKTDFAPAMKALYWHARKTERIKMVQDLVASGLKILLIGGEDWKQVLPDHSNVHFVSTCKHEELAGYYLQSRAVASTNCFNGANERTFDAMSCGSISIAENSPTLLQHFTDSQDIVLYPRLKAAEVVPRIIDLLNDPQASEQLAQRGHEAFSNAHTWDHRAAALSSWIQQLTQTTRSHPQENPAPKEAAVVLSKPSGEPVLFQAYVGPAQKKSISTACTPFDASYNQAPHEREYRLFKDILTQNIAGQCAWGLVSWKFSHKTLVPAEHFIKFGHQKLQQGYDCAFINPMIGNEALFINVWEQGMAVHPGMSVIARQLEKQGAIQVKQISGHKSFAFCNYFIGTQKFWNEYVRFVDQVLHDLDTACTTDAELAKAWQGSARYKRDHSITMQPFVIERLFSSFIAARPDLRIASHPVSKSDYVRKFGHHLGNVLATSHELKQTAIDEPSVLNRKRWDEYRSAIVEQGLVKAVFKMDDPSNQMIAADTCLQA